jgi:biopolymer transport protein ExbD
VKIPIDQSDDAKFEMAPMIDMVFLLLVFFMCASHLSVVQNVELEIPTAENAVVPKERPSRFVVNITTDGKVFGGNVPTDIAGLKDMVKAEKALIPDLKVYLRADQNTPHKHVKKVMNAMTELGIDDFIFGAFKPGA